MTTLKFDIKDMATLEADTLRVTPDPFEGLISDIGYQVKPRSSDVARGAK